jgi:uncharacterized protein YlxP (DUF503 family)
VEIDKKRVREQKLGARFTVVDCEGIMTIGSLKIKLDIPWAQSLKDKRSATKSLQARLRKDLNVSVAEVDHQDVHKTAVLGIVFVTTDRTQADRIAESVLAHIERNTDAVIVDVERDTW